MQFFHTPHLVPKTFPEILSMREISYRQVHSLAGAIPLIHFTVRGETQRPQSTAHVPTSLSLAIREEVHSVFQSESIRENHRLFSLLTPSFYVVFLVSILVHFFLSLHLRTFLQSGERSR